MSDSDSNDGPPSPSGQELFEDYDLHAATISIKQQNRIRRYLYLLLFQIFISLMLESFFLILVDEDYEFVVVAFPYFANSTKLYVIICCLASMEKIQGTPAKILIILVGPIISLYVILYDCLCALRGNDNDAVNVQYIKHFNKYAVSIAAVTAICGVLDALITFVDVYNYALSWEFLFILIWAIFCFLTGTWNLWKLRNDPEFTCKNIWLSPFKMCVKPDNDRDEYESVSQRQSTPSV